jgi:hypothetical protein
MKKTLFLVVLLFVLALSINAQSRETKPVFSAGATLGLPSGDETGFTSFIWGLDVQGEFPVASSFGLTLDAGYVSFNGKNNYDNVGFVPVLAGGKYYFSDQFFGTLQAGLSFATGSGSGSAFTWAPAVGIKLSNNIDIALKYQSATNNGWNSAFIGLRLGINF